MCINESEPCQVYTRTNLKIGASIDSMSHFLVTQLSGGETKEIFQQQSLTFFSLWFGKHGTGRLSTNYYESVLFLLFFGLSGDMQLVITKDFLGYSNLLRSTPALEVHFILAKRITHYAEEAVQISMKLFVALKGYVSAECELYY
jgi:hypothetical protein